MSKQRHFLAVLAAAAVVLSALASAAWAEPPQRVQRVMMAPNATVPLDWDAEGAVVLVVSPQTVEGGADAESLVRTVDFGGSPYHCNDRDTIYAAIVETLNRNLAEKITSGEITEEDLAAIADLVFDVFDGGNFYLSRQVMVVRQGGAERLMNVYFDDDIPPTGARALAGPDGDVLVLGEFWFRRANGNDVSGSYDPVTQMYTVEGNQLVVNTRFSDVKAQIAIGWFTK